MKSLISLWSITAEELAVRCSTSAARDINTVASRTEHEGISFLAISLASFASAFESWLERGFVVPSECSAFRKAGPLTGLPAFLSGFLGLVFRTDNGVLLDEPDIEAVYAIRQLTRQFSKIALPQSSPGGGLTGGVVSPRRERLAMSKFVQCEQDVMRHDLNLDAQYLREFTSMANMLFGEQFAQVDRDVLLGRLKPKHGPGAVADGLTSNGKYRMRTWTSRLQQVMPAEDFLIPNRRYADELNQELHVLEPGAEMPVKVITVPKTLKAPRVIAIEPAAMQYAQQALRASINESFSGDNLLRRVIGIDDQDPNRVLAKEGSHSGDLATLDLSDASDRVSYQHVLAMLDDHPHLLAAVDACRSRKADVPGHGVIRLSKFASMGSALCFPFEAMVFCTVVFLGIQRELNTPLSRDDLYRLSGKVRVFGDDIICPREHVLSVIDELTLFGFEVNVGKSFWTGRFRESCGKEYYDGHDVSIVKVRTVLPTSRQDVNEVIAAFSLRNQFYWSGLWKSAAWMDNYLRRVVKHVPNVAPTSSLLGRESVLGWQAESVHPNHQGPLVKGFYVVAKPPRDPLDGVGALHKCLLSKDWTPPGDEPKEFRPYPISADSVDEKHLERSGRPKRVSIKLGRKSPY